MENFPANNEKSESSKKTETINRNEKDKSGAFSLEGLFSRIKKSVSEKISRIFNQKSLKENLSEEEKKIALKYFELIDKSITESKEAGEYFRNLIPNSLNKPEKEYTHKDRSEDIHFLEETKRNLFENLKKKDTKKFLNFKKEYHSEILEGKMKEGVTAQICYNRYLRKDKRLIVEERVDNMIFDDKNFPFSQLVVSDLNSGKKVDLEQLLPDGYTFRPSQLFQFEENLDEKTGENKIIFKKKDLKSYRMEKAEEMKSGDFRTNNFLKDIEYGCLKEKGSMLALFHEIAHAWQGVYYNDFGKVPFEEITSSVSAWLFIIENEKNKFVKSENENDRNEALEKVIFMKEELKKLGVDIDIKNFAYKGQEISSNEMVLRIPTDQKFVINSEEIKKHLRDYECQERDAWAHAVRMIRFFRKKGIDLEPELKTLDDFKEYINKCLNSYQEVTESIIEKTSGDVRFVKGYKKNIGNQKEQK